MIWLNVCNLQDAVYSICGIEQAHFNGGYYDFVNAIHYYLIEIKEV